MSLRDPNAGNDHIMIPEVYKCLAEVSHCGFQITHNNIVFGHAHKTSRYVFQITCNNNQLSVTDAGLRISRNVLALQQKIVSVKFLLHI